MRTKLFFLSLLFTILFAYFSYSVAKERWQRVDFDTMVKLQEYISGGRFDGSSIIVSNLGRIQRIDQVFSYFSLLGSAEITLGFCLILAFWALIRRRWLAIFGWLTIIPTTAIEVFGKLVIFHPGPPVFFHRSILPTGLPSFYVHTNFSYPSGHVTRTIFIITVFICMVVFTSRNYLSRLAILIFLIWLAFMMGITRVYLGEHWLSDVLGGGFLGAAAGFLASVLILRPKRG